MFIDITRAKKENLCDEFPFGNLNAKSFRGNANKFEKATLLGI